MNSKKVVTHFFKVIALLSFILLAFWACGFPSKAAATDETLSTENVQSEHQNVATSEEEIVKDENLEDAAPAKSDALDDVESIDKDSENISDASNIQLQNNLKTTRDAETRDAIGDLDAPDIPYDPDVPELEVPQWDSPNRHVTHRAFVTIDKLNYYSTPLVNDQFYKGYFSKGTRIGYQAFDKEGEWATATIGNQRIYFLLSGLQTIPRWDSPQKNTTFKAIVIANPSKYYSQPIENDTYRVGSFNQGTIVGFQPYDQDGIWVTATMGSKGRVYFKRSDLESLPAWDSPYKNITSKAVVVANPAHYYGSPIVLDRLVKGSFKQGTVVGFQPYDRDGIWVTATMGSKGRVYFKRSDLETAPTWNAPDKNVVKKAEVIANPAKYYGSPVENQNLVKGSFSKGTIIGYQSFDREGHWATATMGALGRVYFKCSDLKPLPKWDALNKNRTYKARVIANPAKYYGIPAAHNGYMKGSFKKGTIVGFQPYDKEGEWVTATMGSLGRVYFKKSDLRVM